VGVFTLTYESDKQLIEDYVSNNSEHAATHFVRKYQNFVYSIALRYLKNHDDADDASQEAFIKALGNLHRFRGDSNLKTWLYRITANVCTNYLRKKKVMSIFSSGDDNALRNVSSSDFLPDQKVENSEFELEFMAILGKLPKKQRETFALRYFEELPYEEISQMLGTSVGGLKANYHQAVKKLAVYLKKYKK
jgi:RNA polymerase sigma-70 factor, ECF subfamily